MRWFKAALAMMALCLSLVAANAMPSSVSAQETLGPTITVSLASGSQYDTFAFTGQNFGPATRLTMNLTGPDGSSFGLVKDGQPAVWVVSDYGAFMIELVPWRDLAGSTAGLWTASFCVEGATECWSGLFEITA